MQTQIQNVKLNSCATERVFAGNFRRFNSTKPLPLEKVVRTAPPAFQTRGDDTFRIYPLKGKFYRKRKRTNNTFFSMHAFTPF